jgi:hypothetical protein
VGKLIVAITAQFPVAVRPSFGRRLLRAFLRVGIGIAILYLLFYLFGPPLFIFYMTRREAKKNPAMNVVPKLLTDYSISGGPGSEVSFFGYEFTAPWNSKFKEAAPVGNGFVALKFDAGAGLVFKVFPDRGGLITEAANNPCAHMESLKDIFPDLMKRSEYDQYMAVYSATPASIHAFGSRVETNRGMLLLTLKAIAVPTDYVTGAYTFELNGKRGFEIGDPQKTNHIILDIFDVNGQDIEIILATKVTDRLTQPEVNRILSSLHAAPTNLSPAPITPATPPHK